VVVLVLVAVVVGAEVERVDHHQKQMRCFHQPGVWSKIKKENSHLLDVKISLTKGDISNCILQKRIFFCGFS